jgi:hypothetical protein
MKTFRAFAVLGLLAVTSPVPAQTGEMNNSAGGASSGNIPGSKGSGTAANSPTEATGVGSTPGHVRASTMGTPTPRGGSMSENPSGTHTTGRGAGGLTGPDSERK